MGNNKSEEACCVLCGSSDGLICLSAFPSTKMIRSIVYAFRYYKIKTQQFMLFQYSTSFKFIL